MARKLVLQATGEAAELLLDATQSGGAKVKFITYLPKGADGPPLHIHALQSERFEVITGTLLLYVAGDTIHLAPGQTHIVPPDNTPQVRKSRPRQGLLSCPRRTGVEF